MSEQLRVLQELGGELDRAARRTLAPRRAGRQRWLARAVGGLGVGVALACALAVAAVVVLVPRHRPSRAAAVSPQQGLLGSFAALRRAGRQSDLLTGQAFEAIANFPPPIVVDPERSRLVLSKSRELVWLVPSTRDLCEVVQSSASGFTYVNGACGSAARVSESGLSYGDGFDSLTAILPDGASNVRATLFDGSSVTLTPNASGVIQPAFGRPVREVSFRAKDGKQQQVLSSRAESLGFSDGARPPQGRLITQIALRASTRGGGAPSGNMRVYRFQRHNYIWVRLFGLPLIGPRHLYAAWLVGASRPGRLLGFISSGPTRGSELVLLSELPRNPSRYGQVLITRETGTSPRSPGPDVLAGRLRPPLPG